MSTDKIRKEQIEDYAVTRDEVASGTLDLNVPLETYGVGWDGSLEVPTKADLYDKIELEVQGERYGGQARLNLRWMR